VRFACWVLVSIRGPCALDSCQTCVNGGRVLSPRAPSRASQVASEMQLATAARVKFKST